jgi:hypothetical protein
MQMIFRGNLKDKQANAYREWEVKNRQALQETAPPGWIYAGTFFTVFGFGKHDVETRWEISNYAALDTARDYENETWDKLSIEASDFFEPTLPGEVSLVRSAEGVKILE